MEEIKKRGGKIDREWDRDMDMDMNKNEPEKLMLVD